VEQLAENAVRQQREGLGMAEKNATSKGMEAGSAEQQAGAAAGAEHGSGSLLTRPAENNSKLRLVHSGGVQEKSSKTTMMPPPDDRSLQAQLGRQLRIIYQDIAEEPVPERFVELLNKLASREAGKEAKTEQALADGEDNKGASEHSTPDEETKQ
jgi:hypothetical protein